mgnify:CR=1 FL=1
MNRQNVPIAIKVYKTNCIFKLTTTTNSIQKIKIFTDNF